MRSFGFTGKNGYTMRWHKAHRNKRRAPGRVQRRAERAARKPLSNGGWREWLKQLGPTFWQNHLYENSVFMRILENVRNYRVHNQRGHAFPIRPRSESVWSGMAEDSKPPSFPNSRFFVIVDDLDEDVVVAPLGFEEAAQKFWNPEPEITEK